MDSKLLTICIPTYNRSQSLEKLLNQIVHQIGQKEIGKVSLLISDNASTDNTKEICSYFIKKYKYISYHRFTKNTGFDNNYQFLFMKANSRFVHILSDDDFLVENSLPKIISFLESNQDMNACFLNNVSYKTNYESVNRCFNLFLKLDRNISVDLNQFIKIIGLNFSYISSIILNKTYFDNRDLKKYIGTMWMGSYAFLSCITNTNNKFGILAKPAIAYNVTPGLFNYDYYRVFGPNQKQVIKSFVEETNVSPHLLNSLYRKGSYQIVSSISKERILRRKHLFKRFLPFFKATFMYPKMWIIYLSLFFPRRIWILIRKALHKNLEF